jgi:hypothetical protein
MYQAVTLMQFCLKIFSSPCPSPLPFRQYSSVCAWSGYLVYTRSDPCVIDPSFACRHLDLEPMKH